MTQKEPPSPETNPISTPNTLRRAVASLEPDTEAPLTTYFSSPLLNDDLLEPFLQVISHQSTPIHDLLKITFLITTSATQTYQQACLKEGVNLARLEVEVKAAWSSLYQHLQQIEQEALEIAKNIQGTIEIGKEKLLEAEPRWSRLLEKAKEDEAAFDYLQKEFAQQKEVLREERLSLRKRVITAVAALGKAYKFH
jgi:superfamily I DNA and/or RNA helicase